MNIRDIVTAAFATNVKIPDTREAAMDLLRYNWRDAEFDHPVPWRNPVTGYAKIDSLIRSVQAMGVRYYIGGDGGSFDTIERAITVVDASRYPDQLHWARSVLHETTHAIGFMTHAGREVAGTELPYNGEEIVNESAVAALMDTWGLSNPDMLRYSQEYIANWWLSTVDQGLEWLGISGPKMKDLWGDRQKGLALAAEARYTKALSLS